MLWKTIARTPNPDWKDFKKDTVPKERTEGQVRAYQFKGRSARQREQHMQSAGSRRKPSRSEKQVS